VGGSLQVRKRLGSPIRGDDGFLHLCSSLETRRPAVRNRSRGQLTRPSFARQRRCTPEISGIRGRGVGVRRLRAACRPRAARRLSGRGAS
jgi:hypothetical protein